MNTIETLREVERQFFALLTAVKYGGMSDLPNGAGKGYMARIPDGFVTDADVALTLITELIAEQTPADDKLNLAGLDAAHKVLRDAEEACSRYTLNMAIRAYLAALKQQPVGGNNEKWYGYAGHLIVGSRCAYHLSTQVNGYLISTLGDFRPDGKVRDTIGGGKDDFFETMVFRCNGETVDGDPNVLSWDNVDGERYKESIDAEKGHYRYLEKYRKLPAPPTDIVGAKQPNPETIQALQDSSNRENLTTYESVEAIFNTEAK